MPFRRHRKKSYEQPPPSPIEISFWETAKPLIPELQREVWINKKYRVDFLIPSKKIVIELYGYKYHRTKEKLTKDAERERYLQRLGYQVVRFTGSEIYKDVQKCVNEVQLLARMQPGDDQISERQTSTQPIIIPDAIVSPAKDKPINVSSKAKPPMGSALYRGSISLVFVLVIVAVVCLVLTNLSSLIPSPTSGSDRAENSELKKAITHSTLEWQNPKTPGKTQQQITIPANEPAQINFGWCAIDQATLDENWSHIRYSLLIDNSYVELAPKQWDIKNGNEMCRGYSEQLSGWANGRHSFTWFYNLDQALNNGKDVYEPGEYVVEFMVDVN